MSRMLKVGDGVIFSLDGAKGIVLEIGDQLYHIVWEDQFVSWEKEELLVKLEQPGELPE